MDVLTGILGIFKEVPQLIGFVVILFFVPFLLFHKKGQEKSPIHYFLLFLFWLPVSAIIVILLFLLLLGKVGLGW